MLMISKEQLEKYKDIYRKRFGEDISDKEALDQAIKLLTLVRAICEPKTKDEFERLKKLSKEIEQNSIVK